jgi:DNA-binding CsgD family transcriptional regulator
MDGNSDDRNNGLDRLTERERQVLRLVYEHLNSKEIGKRLGIADHTVVNHLRKARERLGVTTRYEAARLLRAAEEHVMTRGVSGMTVVMAPDEDDPSGLAQPNGAPDDTRQRSQPSRSPRTEPGPLDEGRGGTLRERLPEGSGIEIAAAGLDLGAAGATARQPGLGTGDGGSDAGAGLGGAQASPLAAPGDGLAGDTLRGLRRYGRRLFAADPGGRLNSLGAVQRLGVIGAIMLATALAFGTTLSGLLALQQLIRP